MTDEDTIAALRRELHHAQLLNRVMFATSAGLDTNRVLQKICEELSAAFDVPQVGVALLNEGGKTATIRAHTSKHASSLIGTTFAADENPISVQELDGGKPMYVTTAQTDPDTATIRAFLTAMGIVSLLIIPIWSNGMVVGSVGLESFAMRTYTETEIAVIEQVAAAASRALENARLYESAQAELERRREAEAIILRQAAALDEVSTPLLAIGAQAVLMPLIGLLNNDRAQQVIEILLTGIQEHRAHVAILDITGVGIVDTHTAGVLIRAAQAAKLLGARVMLTGIRPEVAQTLVGLGVNLGDLETTGSLQQGIALALQGWRR